MVHCVYSRRSNYIATNSDHGRCGGREFHHPRMLVDTLGCSHFSRFAFSSFLLNTYLWVKCLH